MCNDNRTSQAANMVGSMVVNGVATGVVLTLAVKFVYRYQSGRCTSKTRLVGKTAIVTGASAGIGKVTARDLAQRGARVILACRNVEKAATVAEDIKKTTGNKDVVVRQVDTSDLTSVRKFAKDILNTETALHILVNNAGLNGFDTKKLTADGLELTMATNHFGPFLLTNMLLGLLKASGPSRVVNVSSVVYTYGSSLNVDDLNYEKNKYPGSFISYSQSKLANILFTRELAEKLRGTAVTANSLHPGIVATEMIWKGEARLSNYFFGPLIWFLGKDAELGAQTTIYLAVSDEVNNVTGKYFVDCKESDISDLAKDAGLAKKLWEASEQIVKLKPEETHY
nr:retinol dehydrogenase 11-like isoform X1 [Cherax quadricarinatus]